MASGIFRSTIWNQTIPDELRGRLAGINTLSHSPGPPRAQRKIGDRRVVLVGASQGHLGATRARRLEHQGAAVAEELRAPAPQCQSQMGQEQLQAAILGALAELRAEPQRIGRVALPEL